MSQSTICQKEDTCHWCAEHPNGSCLACAHRRRKVVRLRERDMSVEAIAADMGISVARVERLIEKEMDRRDLAQYSCDEIPVERVQRLFEDRCEQDPTFSIAELARRANYQDRIQVSRILGYQPTSDSTTNGKLYPGRLLATISVEHAGRIVRALGYAPTEVQDL